MFPTGVSHPMSGKPDSPPRKAMEVVTHLLASGKTDTLYRDLYWSRTREFVARFLSHQEYLALRQNHAAIENLFRRIQTAVEQEDWAGIRELAVRIRTLRQKVDGKYPLLELGEKVYETPGVLISPFSPSLNNGRALPGDRLAGICARVILDLSALEKEDPFWREFYAERRAHFQSLSDSLETTTPVEGLDLHLIPLDAMEASAKRNIDLLDSLAKKMLDSRIHLPPLPSTATHSSDERTGLSAPFREEAVAIARKFGLVPARLSTMPLVAKLLRRFARQPIPPTPLSTPEGRFHPQGPPGVVGGPSELHAMTEVLKYIAGYPLMTSGGTRYRPALQQEEVVLVEDFPEEGKIPPESELLLALGIRRRRAVSRLEIEQALFRYGSPFLGDRLGLDPREFRLICIPPDIYARLGGIRRWGRQEGLWTHFDGYQVLKSGVLRALVGGDARFGGIFDLCSIGNGDEREGVILRLAVVRRKRLTTRYL
jgi:hypothetical protein